MLSKKRMLVWTRKRFSRKITKRLKLCEKLCVKTFLSLRSWGKQWMNLLVERPNNLCNRTQYRYWIHLQALFEQISHRGMLPSACILNLAIKSLPDILSDFNDYEKMLIKKVSSFQVVQTINRVSNKHMPHRQRSTK